MKSGEVVKCTQENAKEFGTEMKRVMPEFHELAKELFKRGMIDGMRGARMRVNEDEKPNHG